MCLGRLRLRWPTALALNGRGVDLPLSECQQLAGYFSVGPMQGEEDDDGEPMFGWGQRSDPVYARHWPGTRNVAGGFEVMLNLSETTPASKR
jgi:hypothetical protein